MASPREQVHEQIVDWLTARSDTFTAPYGVLASLAPVPEGRPGKMRLVTFGIARTLDATLTVWAVNRLELKSSRGEEVRFGSAEEFYKYCVEHYGAALSTDQPSA